MNTMADDIYIGAGQPDIDKMKIAESFLRLHMLPEIETEIFPDRLLRSLHAHAFKCRPGTWRNRRNALAHYFDFADDVELACDIKMMVNPVTDKAADKEIRALIPKKQKRTHKVIDVEHAKVVSYLEKTDDQSVLGAVIIARTIGVRPSEMASMNFDDSNQSIFVIGAKKRSKGDRGIDRTLLLELDDYLIIKKAWTQLMTEFNKKDASPQRAMKRVKNRLYTVVRKVFEERESYPSLYSYRHQLGSDLKASGMDRITVAAIMGHASVESVNAYGDRRHGGRKMNIDVTDESLDAVRNIKVTTPPAKSVSAEKVDSEVTTDEIKAMSCPENTVVDEAESPSAQSEADNNQPNLNEHDNADTSSPEPYIKMIKGSKAIMF